MPPSATQTPIPPINNLIPQPQSHVQEQASPLPVKQGEFGWDPRIPGHQLPGTGNRAGRRGNGTRRNGNGRGGGVARGATLNGGGSGTSNGGSGARRNAIGNGNLTGILSVNNSSQSDGTTPIPSAREIEARLDARLGPTTTTPTTTNPSIPTAPITAARNDSSNDESRNQRRPLRHRLLRLPPVHFPIPTSLHQLAVSLPGPVYDPSRTPTNINSSSPSTPVPPHLSLATTTATPTIGTGTGRRPFQPKIPESRKKRIFWPLIGLVVVVFLLIGTLIGYGFAIVGIVGDGNGKTMMSTPTDGGNDDGSSDSSGSSSSSSSSSGSTNNGNGSTNQSSSPTTSPFIHTFFILSILFIVLLLYRRTRAFYIAWFFNPFWYFDPRALGARTAEEDWAQAEAARVDNNNSRGNNDRNDGENGGDRELNNNGEAARPTRPWIRRLHLPSTFSSRLHSKPSSTSRPTRPASHIRADDPLAQNATGPISTIPDNLPFPNTTTTIIPTTPITPTTLTKRFKPKPITRKVIEWLLRVREEQLRPRDEGLPGYVGSLGLGLGDGNEEGDGSRRRRGETREERRLRRVGSSRGTGDAEDIEVERAWKLGGGRGLPLYDGNDMRDSVVLLYGPPVPYRDEEVMVISRGNMNGDGKTNNGSGYRGGNNGNNAGNEQGAGETFTRRISEGAAEILVRWSRRVSSGLGLGSRPQTPGTPITPGRLPNQTPGTPITPRLPYHQQQKRQMEEENDVAASASSSTLKNSIHSETDDDDKLVVSSEKTTDSPTPSPIINAYHASVVLDLQAMMDNGEGNEEKSGLDVMVERGGGMEGEGRSDEGEGDEVGKRDVVIEMGESTDSEMSTMDASNSRRSRTEGSFSFSRPLPPESTSRPDRQSRSRSQSTITNRLSSLISRPASMMMMFSTSSSQSQSHQSHQSQSQSSEALHRRQSSQGGRSYSLPEAEISSSHPAPTPSHSSQPSALPSITQAQIQPQALASPLKTSWTVAHHRRRSSGSNGLVLPPTPTTPGGGGGGGGVLETVREEGGMGEREGEGRIKGLEVF